MSDGVSLRNRLSPYVRGLKRWPACRVTERLQAPCSVRESHLSFDWQPAFNLPHRKEARLLSEYVQNIYVWIHNSWASIFPHAVVIITFIFDTKYDVVTICGPRGQIWRGTLASFYCLYTTLLLHSIIRYAVHRKLHMATSFKNRPLLFCWNYFLPHVLNASCSLYLGGYKQHVSIKST